MSDEPKRLWWHRPVDWFGAALSVLAGAVLGGFFGINLFCQPGAAFDCGVLGLYVGGSCGMLAGVVGYAILRN
jgi:hypothetical protein